MLDSLGKSLSKIIDERLSNPLVVSFIFAWCGWNYKFLVLLFSKTPATQTFDLIKKISFPSWHDYALSGFIYPLATTLLYIYGVPFVSKHINDYWRKKQHDDRKNRQLYEDQRLLTEEESREIKKKLVELEAANETLADESNVSTRNAKEAFKAKAHAEEQAKISDAHEQAATDRYNNMKDGAEAVREERDRQAVELKLAKGKLQELSELVVVLRESIPAHAGMGRASRLGFKQPDDNLVLWYLRGKGVVKSSFNRTMLSMLAIVEHGPVQETKLIGIVGGSGSLLGIRKDDVKSLREAEYIEQTSNGVPSNETYYSITKRGKEVNALAARYREITADVITPVNPEHDAGAL